MSDDDIDPAQLQTQIDLSLSFANDLVSAYLQPTAASLPQGHNTINASDLKDYINRPPR